MGQSNVLSFPPLGKDREPLLVEVASSGSRPLDLKLLGTENSAAFLLKLRHKKISEYKASTGNCTDEEWEQILISTFVDLKPADDLEIRADVPADLASATLSFRRNIHGITQRLGSIQLNPVDEDAISLFDWCKNITASRAEVTEQLAAANAKILDLEQSMKELKAQLDDFITSKDEDETLMLEKFRDLLNEKKVKIRQQQRLLAAAKVDTEKLARLGVRGDETQDKRSAGSSRPGKRKAQVKEEDDDENNVFEQMEVDQEEEDQAKDTEEDEGQASTEDDTASDSGDGEEVPETRTRRTKATQDRRKEPAKAYDSFDDSDDDATAPPERSLPILDNNKVSPSQPVDDDETPSDDDDDDDEL